MKEQALALVASTKNTNDKLNILREYLQAFVLRSLHESEAFGSISFVGGTALRFLYNLPRFSEDLDFSLETKKNYKPQKWLTKLKHDLKFSQFTSQITWNDQTTIHNGWIKTTNLLKDAGLSNLADQKLSIKIEIDTKPPAEGTTTNTLVNKYFLFAIQHHDLPSLMSGRIHALNCRKYTKGRDYYDLLWYRSQRPPVAPNLKLLQNAINQTEKKPWPAKDWQKLLHKIISTLDFSTVIKDVENFLENPEEAQFLNKLHMTKILS